MRAFLGFLLSTAALLSVAACAELTDVSHLTVAEQTEICGENLAATQIVATGRRTGEVNKDYRCRGIHATSYGDRRDRNVQSAAGARNREIDRTLSRGG